MEAWVVGISAFIGTVVGAWLTRDAFLDFLVVKRSNLNGTSEGLVTLRLVREISGLLVCVQFLAADILAQTQPQFSRSLVLWLLVFIPIQVSITGLIALNIKRQLLKKNGGIHV